MNFYNVDLFTLSYCGWCKELKKVLSADGVEYNEKQLDDGAILNEIGDEITVNQFNMLDKFYGQFINAYNSGDEAILRIANELYNQSNETFLSILEDNGENNVAIKEVYDYLSNNQNMIDIYNRFYNAEVNMVRNQDEFGKLIADGKVSATVPQVLINGEVFPHNSSDGDFSVFNELTKCISIYGNSDKCFFEFANHHDDFMLQMNSYDNQVVNDPIELISL